MGFRPEVHTRLTINGINYVVGEHPLAPGVPYGQEGRQGIVYLLYTQDKRQKKAMKVFRSKFVNASMVFQTQQLAKHAGLKGLTACERLVVTPQNNTEQLGQEPDLLYAVVMPWIEGITWMDVMLGEETLGRPVSFRYALALAEVLAGMEQRQMAHCDLSGPNVILSGMLPGEAASGKSGSIQLIDLEQLYAAQLERPEHVPAGSPGYAPQTATTAGLWGPHADRFSGAILISEMLAACTESFFAHAWGESYFAPAELQTRCDRYEYLREALRASWGEGFGTLLERAWTSTELHQCPTFSEWLSALQRLETIGPVKPQAVAAHTAPAGQVDEDVNATLLQHAQHFEAEGKLGAAKELYHTIRLLNPHSALALEVDIAIRSLDKQLAVRELGPPIPEKPSSELEQFLGTRVRKRQLQLVALLGIVILAGLLAYAVWTGSGGQRLSGDKQPPETTAVALPDPKLEQMQLILQEREKTIAELTEQLKVQSLPMAEKRQYLNQLLNADYKEIKQIAATPPNGASGIEKKTFDASAVYLDHLYEFIQAAYGLDEQFMKQTKAVEGYYYPYVYNHDRNAQLNLQFFKDYKGKF
ncbi:hypothetical protein B5M42_000925 [Paenibacillus athensensis]|uniref:Protein kinase domain-containing protein n=1 Tax=Paenibacillus athensensis TaxID=1967502 RepID=A0A4Y8Q8C8_9BACL|nr:hypothetical protein [Paenibacillus athensensis]MCD1257398.1 hypothetical protein [Paenibacillus athensensis]